MGNSLASQMIFKEHIPFIKWGLNALNHRNNILKRHLLHSVTKCFILVTITPNLHNK